MHLSTGSFELQFGAARTSALQAGRGEIQRTNSYRSRVAAIPISAAPLASAGIRSSRTTLPMQRSRISPLVPGWNVIMYSIGCPMSTSSGEVNRTPAELMFFVCPTVDTPALPACINSIGSVSSNRLAFRCSTTTNRSYTLSISWSTAYSAESTRISFLLTPVSYGNCIGGLPTWRGRSVRRSSSQAGSVRQRCGCRWQHRCWLCSRDPVCRLHDRPEPN